MSNTTKHLNPQNPEEDSVSVNESVEEKCSNLKTTVKSLPDDPKQPLTLGMAIQVLENQGIDINDPRIQLILKVIYDINE